MLDIKTIEKNINLISKAGKVMDERIHITGVSILYHAHKHGDFSSINKLFQALPYSSRLEAFKVWVVEHTPLHFEDKTGLFVKSRHNKTEYRVEAANKTPFWKFTVEKTIVPNWDNVLNFDTMISSAIKAADKAESSDQSKGDKAAFIKRMNDFKSFMVG